MIKVIEVKRDNDIILICCIIVIVLYSMAPKRTKNKLSEFLSNDIVLFISGAFIALSAYYNVILAFVVSIIYIIMLLPYFINVSNENFEGFKNENEDDINDDVSELFNAVMGKGKRTKEFMENINNTRKKKERQKIVSDLKVDSNKKENFESEETIELRKFDINSDLDNNLKLTMDICSDIIKRIRYEYESVPYLKKYISSRLQEIIDLLDLTSE